MYRFETIYDAVSAKERRTLSALFSHQLMGEIALEWAELIRSSVKKDHELILFKIFREEKLIGIAILSIIRKLKILQWTAAPSLFKAFINFDVGFIEIPLSNMSGLLTEQGLDIGELYRIMDALCGHIRQKININILCIKINQDSDVVSKSKCNKIDFGMTSYHFKQWLGCELTPASYICCSFTPLISLFKKPLAFFIGHKIRSGGSK
ncbi:hypothetical protein GMJAKD_07690 [Candidatus Electrothrix aarhusensis]